LSGIVVHLLAFLKVSMGWCSITIKEKIQQFEKADIKKKEGYSQMLSLRSSTGQSHY
jgi:hypothetical protein